MFYSKKYQLSLKPALPMVLFVFIFLMGISSTVFAQHYQIRTYREWDGMPTNPVFGATQDSLGIMWFSTRVGLTAYNGQEWTVHDIHPNASPQVHSCLLADSKGSLWAVTSQDPMRISHQVEGIWTTAIYNNPDYHNYIVVGMEVFNKKDGSSLVAVTTYIGEIIFWDGSQWFFTDATDQLGVVHATELVGSRLFLATKNGLFSRDIRNLNSPFELVTGLPDGPITHLAIIPQTEKLWVVGQNWLAHFSKNHTKIIASDLALLPIKELVGTVALADGHQGLFFGGYGSVQYFHTQSGLEILSRFNGLVADGTTGFFRDQEELVWVTSTRGISKIISRRFAGYNRESGLMEDEVSAILELKNGQLIMGHPGGFSLFDDDINVVAFEETIRSQARVMDLLEDKDGNIWIAADRRGLAKLEANGNITWFNEDDNLGRGIYALHMDNNNVLWIGTSQGLYSKNGKTIAKINLPTTLSGNPPLIRKIIPDADGGFYLATPHLGIVYFTEGQITVFSPKIALEGLNTYTCFTSKDGTIFVGSSVGLFKITNDKIIRTTAPDPVISRPIYSIMDDNQGNIWFGTDLGVFHWNGEKLTNFSRKHGLLGNETNRNALIQTRGGAIWIGTDSGASRFNHVFEPPAKGAPKLQITGLLVNGNLFPPFQELHISQPANTIEFQYHGISFLDENQIKYRTRLVNFEDHWNESKTFGPDTRTYIDVPSGKYQFQAQAIRNDGQKSLLVSSAWITVRPSLSERWYFRWSMVLLAIIMGWVIFAFLAGRRYARRLEKEVYQQTWELRLSEKSIKSESMRLAATLKNISDGVLAIDINGIIVLASAHACGILQLPQGEIVGKPLSHILPLDTDDSYQSHLRVPHPKQPNHILEVSSSKVNSPDGPGLTSGQGHVVAFRDITDRLRQEEDRIRTQKLESLGVFAGGLAHDFNNLLTVMLGNLSVLESSTNIPESEMSMLGLVREASGRAQNLTRQLLTFALGGEPLLETDSIARIVRQSVEFALSGTNVSCNLDLPENLWPVVVDPGQMDQVFTNLVINAVQSMPHGGTIQVIGRNIGSSQNPMVLVEIKDEGTGIEDLNIPRLFDPYFTTKDLGSGLGLAIVYSIVTRHGGHITVDSEIDKGSVFRVFLRSEIIQ